MRLYMRREYIGFVTEQQSRLKSGVCMTRCQGCAQVLRGLSGAHSLAQDQSYVQSKNQYGYRYIEMERQREECNRGPEVQSSILSKNALKFVSSECRVGPEGQRWLGG